MKARIPPRPIGLLLLVASGCTTLAHRSIYEAARNGPAQVAEMAIGLLTFVLASTGILMLIHGAKLFNRRLGRQTDPFASFKGDGLHLPTVLLVPAGSACDTRGGVALMQAQRAIAAARRRGGCDHEPVTKPDLRATQKQ